MNQNQIVTNRFSNPESEKKYHSNWEDEPELRELFVENCLQCGGCSFYAPFNSDWGLCCHEKSRHHLETVFEHFTCADQVEEGWGTHTFLDFNLHPIIKKRAKLQFEMPEELYDQAQEIAGYEGEFYYFVVTDALRREFKRMLKPEETKNRHGLIALIKRVCSKR